jgi:histone H2A
MKNNKKKSSKKQMNKNNNKTRKDPISKSSRSGLDFPVGRIGTYLRKGLFAERISLDAAVTLAAVLEYFTSELLEQSMLFMKSEQKKRITSYHIRLAIKNDEEFTQLVGHKGTLIASENNKHKKKMMNKNDENMEEIEEMDGEDEEDYHDGNNVKTQK